MDLFSSQSWTFFGIHDASNSVLLQEGAEEFNIWPFLLISVILILSILFDTCKEVIESNTPEAFEPIMDAFFSELATLGFIGAIAFTLTYNFQKSCEGACSIMQRLSEKFLGEPGELQEIFEGLHFLLFAVSVVFIFTVLILLRVTLLKSKQWADWEYELTKSKSYTQKQPESGKDTLETKKKNFLQSAGYSGSLFDLMSFNVDTTRNEWKHSGTLYGEWIKPDRMARSEFYRLRHRFIQDHQECVETIIPLEFDFGMYLKLTLAHTYAKIIEIKPVDWLVLWILFGVVFFAYYLEPLAIIFTFIAVEFLVLVSAIALQKKLINIRYEMLPPMLDPFSQSSADFEQEESSATSPLLDNNEIHEDPPEQAGENKKKQNQLHIQFLGEPKYQRRSSLHISKPNNPISAMFSSQRLNRHQQLFWFGSHGPSVMVHACKLLLFGSVINLAVVFVELQAALPAERKLLVLGLALVSPVLTLLTMPLTIQTLNLVTNIEHMKSEKILVEVIKHQKFQKQRKVMQMLSSLQFFIDKAEAFATESATSGAAEGSAAHTLFKANEVKSSFEKLINNRKTRHMVDDLRELFSSFDQDNSGAIEREELGQLLQCMGQSKSEDEVDRLFNLMDADGSGDVDFEEFCIVILHNRETKKSLDPRSIAERMWKLFDKDGDGSICPDEMLEAFTTLGKNWDVEDIRTLMHEIDNDQSGTIEKSEFVEYITSIMSSSHH